MLLPILAHSRSLYIDKRLTLDGYVLEALELLDLDEINLQWLADGMGVPYSSLQTSVRRLRGKGLVHIPTIDPRIPK